MRDIHTKSEPEEQHLGVHSHYCDLCSREFDTLEELREHNCQGRGRIITDGGPNAHAESEKEIEIDGRATVRVQTEGSA